MMCLGSSFSTHGAAGRKRRKRKRKSVTGRYVLCFEFPGLVLTFLDSSHDRAFLLVNFTTSNSPPLTSWFRDAVATDIIHQHSERLDYYKG